MKERLARFGWGKVVLLGVGILVAAAYLAGPAGLVSRQMLVDEAKQVTAASSSEAGLAARSPLQPGVVESEAPVTAAAGDAAFAGVGSGDLDLAVAGLDRKVVSTANLQIEVAKGKFQSAFDQALLLAEKYDGYIVSSQSSAVAEQTALRSGNVTLRIPSVSFPQALRDAGTLGTVKARQVDSQDVTGEFVDLTARLKNAQAQEAALQALLAQAKNVDEVLQVRQVLSATQQEIEQLKGRIAYLEEHTSYGTMTLNMAEAGTVVAAANGNWGFVQAVKDALHGFVDTVNALIVGLGSALPILVLLALGAWVVYRVARSFRKRPVQDDGERV